MVISRMQLVKELEPGLNALFGLEYDRYENQASEIFSTESFLAVSWREELILLHMALHILFGQLNFINTSVN